MYSSAFYKLAARTRLKGNYGAAIIATLIYIIPSYLYTLLARLMGSTVIGVIICLLFTFFVINIFNVGYLRFLLSIKPKDDPDAEVKYDYNIVLSGFNNNFKGILKTTFVRELKLLGWGLLPLVPLLVFAGISILTIYCSEHTSEMYSLLTQFLVSPTIEIGTRTAEFFMTNYSILIILFIIAIVGMFALMAPYFYKTFEYAVIEMILADKPEMNTQDAFKRSRDIMHGFRGRLFGIEMSFILYYILSFLILQFTNSQIIYYMVQCMILPYMNITILEFYRERTYILEYNISKYGEQQKETNQ